MPKRNYSNTATPQTLSGAVSDTATTLTVGSTAGYPEVPFLLGLERGTANEEVVLCTAKTGTTFTVTRAYDGTTAQAHAAGTLVEHTVAAIDYRESWVPDPLRIVRSGKDAEDIFTTVEKYRLDGSLFSRSVLSGGTSPRYTTRTLTEYEANGTTVRRTTTYTLAYDVDDALTSETLA